MFQSTYLLRNCGLSYENTNLYCNNFTSVLYLVFCKVTMFVKCNMTFLSKVANHMHSYVPRRTLLSEAYYCNEAWNHRLECSILRNIKIDDLYSELDHQFQHYGKANLLELDLFCNALTDHKDMDKMVDIVFKMKLSPELDPVPSTQHAILRYLLQHKNENTLFKILGDKAGYKIFPDYYYKNLLFDTFVKPKRYTEAAKVSASFLTVGNLSNTLSRYMALYSCYMFLYNRPNENCKAAYNMKTATTESVISDLAGFNERDLYSKNDMEKLVGQTLLLLTADMDCGIGYSFKLLGHCLLKNKNDILLALDRIVIRDDPVYSEVTELCSDIINKKEFSVVRNKMRTISNIYHDDFKDYLEHVLKNVICKRQNYDIIVQTEIYKKWEKEREEMAEMDKKDDIHQ